MQSNYNYADQSAPFWNAFPGFLAGPQHPLFNVFNSPNNERGHEHGDLPPGPPPPMANPWSWGYQAFGGPGGIPHRGGPPPPAPPPRRTDEQDGEKENDEGHTDARDVNAGEDNGEGPSGNTASDSEDQPRHHGRRCGGRRGRCGSPGGRGGFGGPWGHGRHGPGPRHGPHHDHHGSHHGPPHGRRGPRRGNWAPFGGWAGMGIPDGITLDDLPALATQYWNQFVENHPSNQRGTGNTANNNSKENDDFVPEADIFDTESAFVVHVSLPGAKKEDVGVNWDVEKSELSVAGVIYRPGDEDFLKTLAMNERKVGPFERKIKLGSRDSPAHIDADGISAKLEDGILRIEAPKMDMGFVEIRKVDIM